MLSCTLPYFTSNFNDSEPHKGHLGKDSATRDFQCFSMSSDKGVTITLGLVEKRFGHILFKFVFNSSVIKILLMEKRCLEKSTMKQI